MRRTALAIGLALLVAGTTACTPSSPGDTPGGQVRVGAPDDVGGLLADEAIRIANASGAEAVRGDVSVGFEAYVLRDCCASKSQLALSADLLDVAVLCPDAASVLLAKDDRFEILGPVVANSDVVVVRDRGSVHKVGVTQGRSYQVGIVRDAAGEDAVAVPMLTTSLPYAYEKQAVDGVVMDVLKSRVLRGDRISSAPRSGDLVTYVLVVRKDFRSQAQFGAIVDAFSKAADRLGSTADLKEAVGRFSKVPMTEKEVEEWTEAGVRLISVSPTKRY